MPARPRPKRPVETLLVAFEILEFIKDRDGATLTEIAEHVGAAKSTIHRHLETLEFGEYVVRDDGTFHPSLLFLNYGAHAQNRLTGYELAQKKVDDLAAETDERAQFIVEEHGLSVYVYKAIGEQAVRTEPQLGDRSHMHAVSAGKAILAHLPPERIDYIVEQRGLPAVTENTITDESALYEKLERIRERGYAVNNEESMSGLRAIGAPIVTRSGVVGALSISGPVHRMKGEWFEGTLPDLLLGTVNELELNIEHARQNY